MFQHLSTLHNYADPILFLATLHGIAFVLMMCVCCPGRSKREDFVSQPSYGASADPWGSF